MNSQAAPVFDRAQDIRCPDGVLLTITGQYQCKGCGLFPTNCSCPDVPVITIMKFEGEPGMTGGGYTVDPTWGPAWERRMGLVCTNGVIIQNDQPRCVGCELTPYTCCCPDKPVVTIFRFRRCRDSAPLFVPGGHMDI